MRRNLILLVVLTLTSSLAFADAAAIYGSKCAACHGQAGQGKVGPSLQKTSLNAAQIADLLTKGDAKRKAPHSKPMSGMSADDATSVANYVSTLKH